MILCSRGIGSPRIQGGDVDQTWTYRGRARARVPAQVLDLVIDAYGGSRLVRAHGAVAHLVRGHHGLIAGCALARDVLFVALAAPKRIQEIALDGVRVSPIT